MSDKIINSSPEAVNMIARMLGIDKASAEQALAKIAAAVTKDAEADDG